MSGRIRFGLLQPQVGLSFSALKERALACEEGGFHSIWFTDHMWASVMPELDFLEGWTVMSAMAEATSRIRIGNLVICNSYRNPAFLAKMAASLDNVSGGRLELGLGAGWMEEEYRAYGYPFPSGGVRADQLKEGVEIIKKLFTEEKATYHGRYYSVVDAYNNPKPLQKPHPPITIGAAAERKMLRIVAEHADRWNCPASVADQIEHKWGVVTRHCRELGRNPRDIEISEQVIVVLGRDEAEFQRKWPAAKQLLGALADLERTALRGTPSRVIEGIKEKHRKGVTMFTLLFSDFPQPDFMPALELFIREVLPAFA